MTSSMFKGDGPARELDGPMTPAHKLAKRNDPSTSHEAARAIVKKLGKLQAMALDAIREYPDRTAAELAKIYDTRDCTIARRCSELVRKQLITISGKRLCNVTGHNAQTYKAS